MKKIPGVIAIIALAIGLTWAAQQAGDWLGFSQQEDPVSEEPPPANQRPLPGNQRPLPGNEGILPSNNPTSGAEADSEAIPPAPPQLSAEVASIEEDLARIEEALQSDEVLEEFIPSEPLSADNPIPFPTDI